MAGGGSVGGPVAPHSGKNDKFGIRQIELFKNAMSYLGGRCGEWLVLCALPKSRQFVGLSERRALSDE